MESLLLPWIPTFATVGTIALVLLLRQYRSNFTLLKYRYRRSPPRPVNAKRDLPEQKSQKSRNKQETKSKDIDETEIEDLKALKRVYYQLHSLEQFPDVLPKAKRLLLALLKETTAAAEQLPEHDSILSIKTFSRQSLEDFQRRRERDIGRKWQEYNVRRKEGGPRELVGDREEAIWWLKQIAPVKLVDGAWLGHIGKVTTPFPLQKTMKGAWQILSEELGDGDLEKNHVHLFHKLLESLAPGQPSPEKVDFGHPRHGRGELSVWKAATAQLLVSLFPSEFLPEILGYNLHFEGVSVETLKAGKELKEVGIDPYYFILHISIDNAHSGHTAIAIEVVSEYMEYVRKYEGEKAVEEAWRKIQAGYNLSSGLPGSAICPSRREPETDPEIFLSPAEAKVIGIFRAKAQVVHGLHCSSRVKLGSRSVADWLDPVGLESKEWQKGLLDALSHSKYWIRRGDSSKSRFIQELQWSGRMFGSFTQGEYDALRDWIDNLPNMSLVLDDSSTQQTADDNEDILCGNPVFQTSYNAILLERPASVCHSLSTATSVCSFNSLPDLEINNRPAVKILLPLWLSHPCLLQAFVSVPVRTKSKFGCVIVKILRAQGGFDIEQECVGGMCEVRRPNSLGLAGIGTNIMAQHGLSLAEFPSLKHVLRRWPSDFVVNMLHISMRPMQYQGLLVGMATAFAKMHLAMGSSMDSLLSLQDTETLQKIAQRELEGLEVCWNELEADSKQFVECCEGYLMAEHEIKKCFS